MPKMAQDIESKLTLLAWTNEVRVSGVVRHGSHGTEHLHEYLRIDVQMMAQLPSGMQS